VPRAFSRRRRGAAARAPFIEDVEHRFGNIDPALGLISCSMRFIGKMALIISGVTGLPSGPKGGSMGVRKSAARLYHCRGISDSSSSTLIGDTGFLSTGIASPCVSIDRYIYNIDSRSGQALFYFLAMVESFQLTSIPK
jgi:hypothetical protein